MTDIKYQSNCSREQQSVSSGSIDNRATINTAVAEMQANRLKVSGAIATYLTDSPT